MTGTKKIPYVFTADSTNGRVLAVPKGRAPFEKMKTQAYAGAALCDRSEDMAALGEGGMKIAMKMINDHAVDFLKTES